MIRPLLYLAEIQAGIDDMDAGRSVPDEAVSRWLDSWGRKRERQAPTVNPFE
jgi:predicted transcriptional regulator